MPNDLRKMSTEDLDIELREAFAEIWANGFGHPDYAIFPQIVAALLGELKRRDAIKTEVCEAVVRHIHNLRSTRIYENMLDAEAAYRALKGEQDAD